MGLLSKVSAGSVEVGKKATDDVLLLHGMLLMCSADGVMDPQEMCTLEAFYNTLPEFDGKEFDDLLAQANKVVARYGNLKESIKAVAEIQSEAVKRKLFVLAADLAMSSGDVDESEDQMLEAFQRLLGIDDTIATKILEVLTYKYAV
jgi:uncharacterized tellurite resistance protein B-like protein